MLAYYLMNDTSFIVANILTLVIALIIGAVYLKLKK